MELDGDDHVIIGGDFNYPLDPTMDKKGGILIPRQHVINSIENNQNEFSLHDIWRIKNPNTRSFTWSKMSPFIFCRLDYWPISDNLHDLVSKVDILASIKTDHSSIVLELEDIQEGYRGPGFWKLNTSLLTRPDYVDMINNELPIWLEEANDLSRPLTGKLMTDSFNEAFDKKKWLLHKSKLSSESKGQKLFRKLEPYIVNKCGCQDCF